jgi:hypothetical protein
LKKRTKKLFPALRDAWSLGNGRCPSSKRRSPFESFLVLFFKKELLSSFSLSDLCS